MSSAGWGDPVFSISSAHHQNRIAAADRARRRLRILWILAPLAIVWAVLGVWLGRRQAREAQPSLYVNNSVKAIVPTNVNNPNLNPS